MVDGRNFACLSLALYIFYLFLPKAPNFWWYSPFFSIIRHSVYPSIIRHVCERCEENRVTVYFFGVLIFTETKKCLLIKWKNVAVNFKNLKQTTKLKISSTVKYSGKMEKPLQLDCRKSWKVILYKLHGSASKNCQKNYYWALFMHPTRLFFKKNNYIYQDFKFFDIQCRSGFIKAGITYYSVCMYPNSTRGKTCTKILLNMPIDAPECKNRQWTRTLLIRNPLHSQ